MIDDFRLTIGGLKSAEIGEICGRNRLLVEICVEPRESASKSLPLRLPASSAVDSSHEATKIPAQPAPGTKITSRQARQERKDNEQTEQERVFPWRPLRLCERHNPFGYQDLQPPVGITWRGFRVVAGL